MNLLVHNQEDSIISYFRSFEYAKFDMLIDLGMKYLINCGLNVDPKVYSGISDIHKVNDISYSHLYHFECTTYKIKISNEKNINWFLYLSVPDLIDGMFFKLNSTYYIPIMYIADEPIVSKENSMLFYSIFQPITLYFSEQRVIFMGSNYVLADFLNFITWNWDPYLRQVIEELLNIKFNNSLTSIITHLANRLNCLQEYDIIKDKINSLFFDDYTLKLYQKCYDVSDIDGVIQHGLLKRYDHIINNKIHKFNDLRFKRLIFIEMILKPYFKAISGCSKLLLSNKNIFNLKMKINELVENFYLNLNGNCLYDTVNGFSGILSHKATFQNPYGSGELPKEVSSIHWTHKDRICPNSISNHDSGRDVFLVPNQKIDLDFGLFKFSESDMELPS